MVRRLADFSDAVRESTLKRLRQVPAGFETWRPDPDAMSFADVAQHILECDEYLYRVVEGGPQPVVRESRADRPLADLIDALERAGARRREWLLALSDLGRAIVDERFGETTVWWVVVRGNLDHEAHHRGQIAAYLRLVGRTGRAGVPGAGHEVPRVP